MLRSMYFYTLPVLFAFVSFIFDKSPLLLTNSSFYSNNYMQD